MWTIVRFALHGDDARRYRAALELLDRAGFEPYAAPACARCAARETCCALPAAVVGEGADHAALTRAVFTRLQEAQLRPVAVTGAPAGAPLRASPV